jgi:hypothetical protein
MPHVPPHCTTLKKQKRNKEFKIKEKLDNLYFTFWHKRLLFYVIINATLGIDKKLNNKGLIKTENVKGG